MNKNALRVGVLVVIAVLAYIAFSRGWLQQLTLENLRARQNELAAAVDAEPFRYSLGFFVVYALTTALSFPGAAILTLAGGAIFGLVRGTLLVSLASTVGATLAFLIARFVFRDTVQKKWHERLERINEGVKSEGKLYLLSLRLVPLFPFFLVNLLMGLTSIPTLTYAWVSLFGMLPGTIVYVNAGTQLGQLAGLRQILSPGILLSFVALGVFPFIASGILGTMKARKVYRGFKRPARADFNVVVIGAGSAGLVSAYIAAAVKAKVALIEKSKMGGDCLNTGCVPSKALIRSARFLADCRRAREFGFDSAEVRFEFSRIMDRVQRIIHEIEPHDSVERYRGLGVECISGDAKLVSPFEVEVEGRRITARSLIIATGGEPRMPDLPGLKEAEPLNSDTVWGLRQLPARLLVLGGGPIGCELSQCFSRLGSKVTLVQSGSQIMGREDVAVARHVQERFEKEGIQVLLRHSALRVEFRNGERVLICESEGKEVAYGFDRILVAVGRKARTRGFGLEELGVQLNEGGTIRADEFLRTNFPNIYVCGDVAGPFQFTHFAAHQAWYAAVNALFSPFRKFKTDYRVIPWTTFTDPEVARVGLSETEAREKGTPYELTRYGINDLDRAITESEADGFVQILTVPGKDRILGVTIVGAHAGDMIPEFVTAMKYGIGLNKVLGTIHIYPTFSEANKYAAGVWKKAHAPAGVLRWVERYHAWRRA